jgi:hypothetical protein
VFASPKIVEVVEAFVKRHCSSDAARGKERSYKWAVNHIGSFLAIVRYVGTLMQVQPAVLTRLVALHKQTLQQSRLQSKFAIANAPVAWLEWPAVLQARVSAERAVAAYKGSDLRRRATLTRNVLLMRLHSDQPPDRVGVLRTLQLNSTLCKRNGVWMLSLSEPEQHKTSKLFGAQTTELNASVVEWLDRYLELTFIPNGGHLFHAKGDVTRSEHLLQARPCTHVPQGPPRFLHNLLAQRRRGRRPRPRDRYSHAPLQRNCLGARPSLTQPAMPLHV